MWRIMRAVGSFGALGASSLPDLLDVAPVDRAVGVKLCEFLDAPTK